MSENPEVNLILSPFDIPEVLEKIVSYLDIPTLKSVRCVNSLIYTEATKALLRKCVLSIPLKLHKATGQFHTKMYKSLLCTFKYEFQFAPTLDLENPYEHHSDFINEFKADFKTQPENQETVQEIKDKKEQAKFILFQLLKSKPTAAAAISLLLRGNDDVKFFKKILTLQSPTPDEKLVADNFTTSVKSLKFSPGPSQRMENKVKAVWNFLELLQLFPGLQELRIPWTELFFIFDTIQSQNKREEDFATLEISPWRIFPVKLASLQKIELEGHCSPNEFRNFLQRHSDLKSISYFEIFDDNQEILSLYISSQAEWRIQKLDFVLMPQTAGEVARKFLQRVSRTLEHLRIHFDGGLRRDLDWEINLELDEWLIPVTLDKLKSLELHVRSDLVSSRRTHFVALQLPALTKLTIPLDGLTFNFDESSDLHSKSLEELEIVQTVANSLELPTNARINFKPYPNLTRLAINVHLSSRTWTRTVLQDIFDLEIGDSCPKLERLELTLQGHGLCSNVDWEDWDEILTGRIKPKEWCWDFSRGKTPEPEADEEALKSIVNLKHLKSLRIVCDSQHESSPSDFFLSTAISRMGNLQSFYYAGKNQFSLEAIEAVKSILGPNVSVIISSV